MKAYRCDRCGDYYMFEEKKKYIVRSYINNSPSEVFDLCADCNNKLNYFFSQKILNKEENEE